ncbi:MAG: hydrogenase maturation nickel metallochaperone HypA [Lachnospiraceae bacterium]|jgi:hydrogenase nickel incorporation protein HypA/HybF|nr:hydrogenase maturation nickel metallochaperone HypA [Lachnospiraceae bacterium]MCI1399082.1 hydrogenase maturation nickel metallochaperone HypA [Lachnospiraceae bacterium]MCI1424962.1 hydrogenase maturation nickel metallochaperone HypA [Lachnospiraceae bacterium]MCI1453661.1 hydrogenase maturation nickel metallochaperone HypA [Lachnospiraceae bacterium]MDD5849974.1 hydrogenase maturation nickel metallochaperone HypA [Bacillota bacterium]
MHELPAVLSLLDTMEKKAAASHIRRITEIDLKVGELSDLVEDCIQLYFDMASEGTVCEGASLVFSRNPALLRCNDCGYTFPHERSFTCPRCGGASTLVRGTGGGLEIIRFLGEDDTM